MQENIRNLLPEIYKHVEEEAPKEACGIIVENKNFLKYIRMENESPYEDDFIMNSKEWVKHSIISKILYIVHSHYMEDCYPSDHDKNIAKVLGIPYLIVSYPNKGEFIYDPR